MMPIVLRHLLQPDPSTLIFMVASCRKVSLACPPGITRWAAIAHGAMRWRCSEPTGEFKR